MLYVKVENGLPVKIADKPDDTDKTWQSRWDWNSMEEAERLASYITAMQGETYIATDSGPGVSPRYDIMKLPKVGDPVSYGFNGDYYPDGFIAKISKKLMITTNTGSTYRRRKNTGSWQKPGGTWSLVKGHHDERNPHF